MKIMVMSRQQAENDPPPTALYAHISILDPGHRTSLPVAANRLATLYLEFDDVREEGWDGSDSTPISDEQAREIVLFVKNLPPAIELLVCQCHAGISRSSGTAAAISKFLGLDDSWIFNNPNFSPNPLVMEKILLAALVEQGPHASGRVKGSRERRSPTGARRRGGDQVDESD